ncbi:hypothetical protein NDU88_006962 [Pleurodeles waltl]|uniref:Uncharacterized protein n=1 Tax=Pleurodeles waltl TaxID=8319 RepID=A0AAV7N0X3_PLEWA|nr:hypothetical protein NDU88_006962 [Pleurodeles waltl]
MSAGRRSLFAEESGAAIWIRADLELRRSRRAASRFPLWGNAGRGSTSCQGTMLAGGGGSQGRPTLQRPVKGLSNSVSEAGTFGWT